MADTYFYKTEDGHGLPHDPFKAIIAPRPIGWISTLDAQGRANLAPYSFFNAVSDTPPMIAFSSTGWKDSASNASATGEFCWNMATRELANAMNISSKAFAHGESEFELAELEAAPCRIIKAQRVAAAPAAMECRLVDIIPLRDMDGNPTSKLLVIGQVVAVHIAKAFLRDGLFDTGLANPILRAGYLDKYAEARPDTMFDMDRPR